MRLRAFAGCLLTLPLALLAQACGDSDGDAGPAAGSAGEPSGTAGKGAGAGMSSGGSSAGTESAAGKSAAGSAQGGSTVGGADQGAAGSEEPGEAGSSAGGAPSGLVSCDPKKVFCKLLPGDCPAMQVRAVKGTCWGDCVKIDQCACSAASDCPDENHYTCWAKQHCGPYVL